MRRKGLNAPEFRKMGAHEYLEKYIRTVPGGAIAWERSIFSHSGQWTATELIDAAVDLAWDLFGPENGKERTGLDIHRAGNYFVIAPLEMDGTLTFPMAA
ncbi:MAG: hypothetical protein ACPG3U_05875 [Rhodothermales bacterium]